jgi:hypothetical protein
MVIHGAGQPCVVHVDDHFWIIDPKSSFQTQMPLETQCPSQTHMPLEEARAIQKHFFALVSSRERASLTVAIQEYCCC